MQLLTGAFITVLLGTIAQGVTAAPQQNNNNRNQTSGAGATTTLRTRTTATLAPAATPIPADILAAQQSSAAAAASSAAAANAAAAESGLRQPPGLQDNEFQVSLRPLPALATGDGATSAVLSSTETSPAVSSITSQGGTQPVVCSTAIQSTPETLRQLPGLNTETLVSFTSLSILSSVATSIAQDTTTTAAQVVGFSTQTVTGRTKASAGAGLASTPAGVSNITSAGVKTSTITAVLPSLTLIAGEAAGAAPTTEVTTTTHPAALISLPSSLTAPAQRLLFPNSTHPLNPINNGQHSSFKNPTFHNDTTLNNNNSTHTPSLNPHHPEVDGVAKVSGSISCPETI